MRLPAALILVCAIAFGQQIYRVGNGVTAPELVSKVDPQYSEEARLANINGTVRISLVVGEDGEARNVHALTSPGLGLDEAAIAAVSKWRFKPGLKDGTPVPVSVDVEVSFRLLTDPGAWSPSRVTFDSPEGTARPILTAAPYPPMYSAIGATGSVALSFDVASTGAATNLHIIKSSDPASESEVIRIVRGWQFQPAVKDGRPVSVRCTMEFAKGNL
jgi:TonB family protein